MGNNMPQRNNMRLHGYNYNNAGAYFLTICTENRNPILSDIISSSEIQDDSFRKYGDCCVILKPFGQIAEKYIEQIGNYYSDIKIERYVIMPNHIHVMFRILENKSIGIEYTKQHMTVSKFVSTFKRFCNKEYSMNIWQRGYYDHIIRNIDDYNEHIYYIMKNPHRYDIEKLQNNNMKCGSLS